MRLVLSQEGLLLYRVLAVGHQNHRMERSRGETPRYLFLVPILNLAVGSLNAVEIESKLSTIQIKTF